MIIKLCAENDRDGNARRLFVRLEQDNITGGCEVVGTWDEGNRGDAAGPGHLQKAASMAPSFEITPNSYRTAKRGIGQIPWEELCGASTRDNMQTWEDAIRDFIEASLQGLSDENKAKVFRYCMSIVNVFEKTDEPYEDMGCDLKQTK